MRGRLELPVTFILEGSPFRPADGWHLEAYAAADHSDPVWSDLTEVTDPSLSLTGRMDNGRSIHIPVVHWTQQSGSRLTAEVWDIRYDCTSAPEVPATQHATVYLTQTPLALPIVGSLARSWTGELSPLPGDQAEHTGVTVLTNVGDAKLQLIYVWDDVDVEGVRADLRVPVPAIQGDVNSGALSADPDQILEAVGSALEDTLDVLSLLSRRYVRWTRIKLYSTWLKDGQLSNYQESEWVRTIGASPTDRRREALVAAGRMPPDALSALVAQYSALPRKHAVRAAITYCLAVEDSTHLESSLSSAFTAIEALLSSISLSQGSGSEQLDRAAFRDLHERISELARVFVQERQLDSSVADMLVRRVGDLGRRPVSDRLQDVVVSAGVSWQDLWPDGTTLSAAMGQAFRRRNQFFHVGRFPGPKMAYVDARRLRILCERLLFSLIGGETQWQSWRTYEESAWLASHPA